ncbi:hypothetical protein SBA4_720006 [Candidatus Sulfopaludibacter sp. SbA4]|nr:hypothetical protein SBA4_720006 [Candidatus Sulfopaludibacter sp. SbA4]
MEFKMFGPGGSPSNRFEKGLKTLLGLDEAAWDVIASWILTTDQFDAEEAVSSPAIAASSLLPGQFIESVEVLQSILKGWHIYDLRLTEIQRDLLLMGHPREDIERLGRLLERIAPIKQRVYAEDMRFDYENAVLPTLEDVDVVCDLRPIFEDYAYPLPEGNTTSHTRLLGFSRMVLVELLTEDFHGRTHKLAFQMTEQRLTDLQAALARASEQLAILKAKTRDLSTEER